MNQSISFLDRIHLDRKKTGPLYLQLATAIRAELQAGRIVDRAKLPSTREVAERLGINRATVVEAYRLLRKEGWVVSGVGAGTFVRRLSVDDRPGSMNREAAFWSSRVTEMPRPEARPVTVPPADDTIRLTALTADPSAFPVEEFREALNEIFREEGPGCLDYGPPDGYTPLRETIAERLEAQGVSVDTSRIILVNGSQQGLELVLRLLVPRGRTLLLEEPTYQLALRTARALGLITRPVPMDEEGLRVDALERILEETPAELLYTMPVFQNPTGLTLSPERRKRLLDIASAKNLPIIEDHFDAELDYRGDAPPPLLAEDGPPGVLLLGTFSKVLFPGPRVGWLVVPEPLVGPLSELKICADLSGGLLTQMALHRFIENGHLDKHLGRIRKRNGARLAALLSALEETMPPGAHWTHPTGGMTLWLWLPKGLDSENVAREAMRRGVAITPGPIFHVDDRGRDGLRLCYVREDEKRIRQGIQLLAETIQEQSTRLPEREADGAAAPML